MVIEYGIMSNKWSIEADEKLTAYAAIMISQPDAVYMIMLYTEECRKDQWAFSNDLEKRIGEIFGGSISDFNAYVKAHENEIKAALETIKKLV